MTRPADTIRIGIVHPQRTWLEALEFLLSPTESLDIVVAHPDYRWVASSVARGDIDVVLVSLAVKTPGEAVTAMRESDPTVGIVVISEDGNTDQISDLVRAGVRGWVLPTATRDEMVQVIRGVVVGESWFPPAHLTRLLDSLLEGEKERREVADLASTLSARELEILGLLAEGLPRQEVAERLHLSPHTVRTHINHLLHKLDVHSTLAAVSIARRMSLPGRQLPDHDRHGPPSGVGRMRPLPDPRGGRAS